MTAVSRTNVTGPGGDQSPPSVAFSPIDTPQLPYEYSLPVDPKQNDRALQIQICSTARPHMRAFHASWVSFFTGFFLWFSISPLLAEIQGDLGLSRSNIWVTTICSDISTQFFRWIMGPICDQYGARLPMAIVLVVASIPVGLTGSVNSYAGLAILRFAIGIVGTTFVMSQYWTSRMFAKDVTGTANAIVAGWGNSGAGVASLVMGTFLFPLFRDNVYDDDSEKAWRTIFVIPAVIAVLVGLVVVRCSDDAPQGYYSEMKRQGTMDLAAIRVKFRSRTSVRNAWLLAIQYAVCFGVEITMNNALSFYFQDVFGENTESAAALTSIFGLMNLFARACGGIVSDRCNSTMGMKGRLWTQTLSLVLQGCATIGFAFADSSLSAAIPTMIVFSIFVQASEGAIFGTVPYVNSPLTGQIAGIVGSGGNFGGVIFSICFTQFSYQTVYIVMGVSAIVASSLSMFIHIPGHAGLLWGTDIVSNEPTGGEPIGGVQSTEEDVNRVHP